MSGRFAIVIIAFALGSAARAETPRAFFGDAPFDRPIACEAPAFPMRPSPLLSDFIGGWYLKVMSAADEPSLYRRSLEPGSAVYRFSWLRSFHAPMTVRVEETVGGDMRLIAKRLSGQGGYDPGEIAETIDRPLSKAERVKVEQILAGPRPQNAKSCPPSTDGAEWIFEAAVAGEYDLVVHTSPRDGPLREAGETFLALTGWSLEPIY